MRELLVLKELNNGKRYEKLDYFNYLLSRKERLARTKKIIESNPGSTILFYQLVKRFYT